MKNFMKEAHDRPNEGSFTISSTLLQKVKEGDQIAWGRLVQLYHPLVYRWCRRAGLPSNDAREVGQEVFIAVYKGIGPFQRSNEGHTFTGWVRRITQHKTADWYRERRSQPPMQPLQQDILDERDESDPNSLSVNERSTLLHGCLEVIRAEYSEVHWLAYLATTFEGKNATEAAKEIGLSANAINLARMRINRRLREVYNELLEPNDLE
jgi:RNA polymerase sigma-70 factor (ECF subfamily)